jgi:hypothetical protein
MPRSDCCEISQESSARVATRCRFIARRRRGSCQNARQLRPAVVALCQDLRRELAHLDAGAILGTELKEIYEYFYQERTVSLVDALIPYSPADCCRTIGYAAGGQRIVKSAYYDLIAGRLHADIIAVEISTIVQMLEILVDRARPAPRLSERDPIEMAAVATNRMMHTAISDSGRRIGRLKLC